MREKLRPCATRPATRAGRGFSIEKSLWLVLVSLALSFVYVVRYQPWHPSGREHERTIREPCEFFVNVIEPQLPQWRREHERELFRESMIAATQPTTRPTRDMSAAAGPRRRDELPGAGRPGRPPRPAGVVSAHN